MSAITREINDGESVAVAVVKAVADATGKPTEDLEPLHDSIPTDPLDELFHRSGNDDVDALAFTYENCRISISPGSVSIEQIPRV